MTQIGLGKYLESIDPTRSWAIHIQYILIYCRVHFARGIQSRFASHPMAHAMRSLPDLTSAEDCHELLDILTKDRETRDWALHKQRPWVLSGLNVHCSKVDHWIFESVTRNSNLIESTHHKANQYGIRHSLLSAIYM